MHYELYELASKLEEAAGIIEMEAMKIRDAADNVRDGKVHRGYEAISSIIDLPRQAGLIKIIMLLQMKNE